jgi:hypothetical protein
MSEFGVGESDVTRALTLARSGRADLVAAVAAGRLKLPAALDIAKKGNGK